MKKLLAVTVLLMLTGCGDWWGNYETSQDAARFINRCPTLVRANSHFEGTLVANGKSHVKNETTLTCEYDQ